MPTRFTPTDILSTYAALTALNGNFDEVATLFDLCVMRDGSAPNSMLADLDLNHFKIQNVADAVDTTDAVNLGQVQDIALGNMSVGTFRASPNYVGASADSNLIIAQGTLATPSTTQGSSVVVSKQGNASAFNSFSAFAFKSSSSAGARATACFAEAADNVGGATSFVEGARFHGTLAQGNNGSAYGAIMVAGTNASGLTAPLYLIPSEAQVNDQIGPDAVDYTSFNKDSYKAAYVATIGFGASCYKIDAAFLTNPYSAKAARTGLFFTAGTVDHTGIAYQTGVSLVNGIDMSLATISGAAFKSPGFVINANGTLTLTEIAAGSVASPASGKQTLFIDTADHKLKRKDSTGTVTIIG